MTIQSQIARAWKGFLPRRAIVMASARPQTQAPVETPSATPLTPTHDLVFVGTLDAVENQLLDRMISAMGLTREAAPVVDSSQLSSASIRPRMFVALGDAAAQSIPVTDAETLIRITFHPSELLAAPDLKREAWAQLQEIARELGIQIPAKR